MKQKHAFIMAACLSLAALSPLASNAAATKAPPDTPTAAEQPFVTRATAELQKMYGTTSKASAAGYFRYNNEDRTGAISWVNPKYWVSDETHPSQIWYDVKGRLIGVDYSTLWTDAKHPPSKWGIIPARWFEFENHVHFGLMEPDATLKFGGMEDKTITKVGGDAASPTAADIVKTGKALSAAQVAFVFHFAHLWDLEFWLIPNPSGAFAEKNPNVKPSTTHAGGM
jgi:hypothetical protein